MNSNRQGAGVFLAWSFFGAAIGAVPHHNWPEFMPSQIVMDTSEENPLVAPADEGAFFALSVTIPF
jgi:hypothetical protein